MLELLILFDRYALENEHSWILKNINHTLNYHLIWKRNLRTKSSSWTLISINNQNILQVFESDQKFNSCQELIGHLHMIPIDVNEFYLELSNSILALGVHAALFIKDLKKYFGEEILDETIQEVRPYLELVAQ